MTIASSSAIPITTASWFPVVTLVVGYAISFFSDWVKNRRENEREREARREARRDRLSDQRRGFQRETLLALQEAVQDLARATGASLHHDEIAYRETGRWQRQLIDEDLDQQILLVNRRVMLMVVRVRDQPLRETVQRFRRLANDAHLTIVRDTDDDAAVRERSEAAMRGSANLLEGIHERIGEILRTLDDEETTELITS